jgi:CHAT domain-containing protein
MPIHQLTFGRITRYVSLKLSVFMLVTAGYSSATFINDVEPKRATEVRDFKEEAIDEIDATTITLPTERKRASVKAAIAGYLAVGSHLRTAGEWRAAGDLALSAAELNFTLGEYRQSLECSHRAASDFHKANERLGESRALGRVAQVSALLGDHEQARILARKALNYYSKYGDKLPASLNQPFSQALSHAGEVYYCKGDLTAAYEYFEKSLRFAIAASDRDCEARARLFLGYISATTGDTKDAKKQFERSLNLSRELGNPASEGLALAAVATAHSWARDNEWAIKLYRQALANFRQIGDLQNEAAILVGIGQAYQNLHESHAALSHYKEGLKIFEEDGNLDYAAVALYQIAKLLEADGAVNEAEQYYKRCLRLSRGARKERILTYALKDLTALQMMQVRRRDTLREYHRALRFYERIGDRLGQALTLNNIGELYFASGKKSKSLDAYRRALALSPQSGDRSLEVTTRYNIAKVERALGKIQQAVGTIKASIDLIEELRSNVSTVDLRSSYFSGQRKNYDLYIDLLMQLDQQLPGKGLAALALLASENSRARTLREILAENTYSRQDTVKEPMKLSSSLGSIQSELRGGNTLLLEYALGDERSYLWSVTEDSVKGYVLPGKGTLEQSARALYTTITARQLINAQVDDTYQARVEAADKQYQQEALHLSRMLLEPVVHELGNNRLIIVSEGALQFVPFEALPTPSIAKGDVGEPNSLLISRHEIVSLPSMSVLTEIRAIKRQPSLSGRIAVFADPVSSASDDRLRSSSPSAVSASSLIRLAHSAEEADEIAKISPRNTWIAKGFDANREKVLTSLLTEYRIVHFATHGLIDTQHPELSGLVLSIARPDGSLENGYLKLHDIYGLKMAADVTVLSACDTALGKDVKGEGLIGLTRGFIYAGSKSVVASLWKVDDRATAVLMKHFYEKMLRDGLPPAAALRSAKEIVRQQPGWSAPYFWAGFVIQGEYLEPIESQHAQPLHPFALIMLVLSSVITAVKLIKNNRRTGQSVQ